MYKRNAGFTLVEIIVVVVILSIIAAFLVPKVTSYLTKSNDKKNQEDAKDILDSIQIEFYDLYAENSHDNAFNSIVYGNPSITQDTSLKTFNCESVVSIVDITNKKIFSLAADVFKNLGYKVKINDKGEWKNDLPCCVMAITGDYKTYCNPENEEYSPEKAYTVYALLFNQNIRSDFFLVLRDGSIRYPKNVNQLDEIIDGIVDSENPEEVLKKEIYIFKGGAGDDKHNDYMWRYFHKNVDTQYSNASYTANQKKEDVVP